jgi:hypothetical protein
LVRDAFGVHAPGASRLRFSSDCRAGSNIQYWRCFILCQYPRIDSRSSTLWHRHSCLCGFEIDNFHSFQATSYPKIPAAIHHERCVFHCRASGLKNPTSGCAVSRINSEGTSARWRRPSESFRFTFRRCRCCVACSYRQPAASRGERRAPELEPRQSAPTNRSRICSLTASSIGATGTRTVRESEFNFFTSPSPGQA